MSRTKKRAQPKRDSGDSRKRMRSPELPSRRPARLEGPCANIEVRRDSRILSALPGHTPACFCQLARRAGWVLFDESGRPQQKHAHCMRRHSQLSAMEVFNHPTTRARIRCMRRVCAPHPAAPSSSRAATAPSSICRRSPSFCSFARRARCAWTRRRRAGDPADLAADSSRVVA